MSNPPCINLNIGNPSIPRVWGRFSINNDYKQGITNDQYQMRKKSEILQYKNNSDNLSAKRLYAQKIRGKRTTRRGFANQNDSVTNPNIYNLTQQGNTLIFPCDNSIKYTPTSASDVPSSSTVKTLYYDKSIPKPLMNTQRYYPTSDLDWKKLNKTKIENYANNNNYIT